MKIPWIMILSFTLLTFEVCAQTSTAPPGKIIRPVFLGAADKFPGIVDNPGIPNKGSDGALLKVKDAIDAPSMDTLAKFSDPELFETIKKAKRNETQINQIYWHSSGDFKYCHLRDSEGNNWYGWSDGQAFHWILWRGNRFWWRDSFAGNWLYYARRNWWRCDLQTPSGLQVLINGEYYLCLKDGTISKDMGPDGKGLIDSGTGRFRGDFHHGGHSHEGGHSEEGSKAPSNEGGTTGAPVGN